MKGRGIPLSGNVSARPKGRDPPRRQSSALENLIYRLGTENSEDSLSLLATILENAPIGFAYMDTGLRYRLVNGQLATINGMSIENHFGKQLTDVIPTFPKKLIAKLRLVIRTGKPVLNVELRGTSPRHPGEERYWRESFYPIRNRDGVTTGVGAIVIDITKRRRNERFREDFFRMASHEIKNPLSSVKAFSQIVLKNLKSRGDAENAELVSRIDRNANKIHYLIKSLMDLTKTESGTMEYRYQPITIDDVVREAVRDNACVSAKHRFVVRGKTDTIMNIDRERIMQVLNNLLSNAVKYSPDGGNITVRMEKKEEKVVVSVRDEGIGIPKTKLKTVFRKYYRADNGSRQREGLGLGLYISSQIIKHYRGKIWAESIPGKGSTFFFALPATFRGKRVLH